MDFLRLHLPGLHQALRGALDSFSTFVSYLMGDEVPTAEGREAQAAKELGEVDTGRPKRAAEKEEAQEALEHLGGSRKEGNGGLSGPAEVGRHQEESIAAEQTWGWGGGSSHGSQAGRQDTGAWEAAKVARCQELSAPSEAEKSQAGSVVGRDRSCQAQERQEPGEQEVNTEERLRTWEQVEEEEEVRAREPEVAEGEESGWTQHREPEGKAGVGWQNEAKDGKEAEQVVKEAVAEETQAPEARGPESEEEVVVVVRGDQITGAQEPQGPGTEPEVWVTSGSEEAWTTSGREKADHPAVRETEFGAVPGERTPEGTESIWALDEASRGDWEEEVDEKREVEESLIPRQTQALGAERVEEGAGGQAAGREAAGALGSEEEVEEGFEDQADQSRKEGKGRQDSEIRADQARLEEVVQAEEAKEEKGSGWAAEVQLSQDKEAKGAQGDADLETTPEARSEKVFTGQESEKEAQTGGEALRVGWGGLECELTEGQEPELMLGAQSPTKKPEGGQGVKEELWRAPALSKEETEGKLEEDSRYLENVQPDIHVSEGEAWRNQRRRDVETGNSQEKADAEEAGEEAAGGQALEAEAERGQEEWKKAKDTGRGTEENEALEAENREPGGSRGAGAWAGQSLEDSEAKDVEVEVVVPWGTDRAPGREWRLEEVALNLQDSEDVQTRISLATKIVEDKAAQGVKETGVEEGPEEEAGNTWEREFKRGWDSEEREEAGGDGELPEAQHGEAAEGEVRGEQEFSLESSAKEGVTGRGHQAEAFEAKEGESEVGESAVAEGSWKMDHFTSGSHVVTAEGTVAMGEAEGLPGEQTVERTEVGVWEAMEQRVDSEGQHPEGLEDVKGQKEQPTIQDPPKAEPKLHEAAEAAETTGSAREHACSSWNEALLPGSRLDVSVPRSRVLLSRSSSQRRSRPSFRRTPSPAPQEEPPSPPPEADLSAPQQRLLQSVEPPEPSPPKPEGTPVPARKRPLGHGFGLAHSGMMQELQARLGQPKPQ
uniref:Apolipoprotein B receptor n=1 Tax=Loxodonta africana TaxID=9785 RepID=G3TPL7_LOXAF